MCLVDADIVKLGVIDFGMLLIRDLDLNEKVEIGFLELVGVQIFAACIALESARLDREGRRHVHIIYNGDQPVNAVWVQHCACED